MNKTVTIAIITLLIANLAAVLAVYTQLQNEINQLKNSPTPQPQLSSTKNQPQPNKSKNKLLS